MVYIVGHCEIGPGIGSFSIERKRNKINKNKVKVSKNFQFRQNMFFDFESPNLSYEKLRKNKFNDVDQKFKKKWRYKTTAGLCFVHYLLLIVNEKPKQTDYVELQIFASIHFLISLWTALIIYFYRNNIAITFYWVLILDIGTHPNIAISIRRT